MAWEGGLVDSISTPFKVTQQQQQAQTWAVFYGSGPPPHNANWNVGIATTPTALGPWTRLEPPSSAHKCAISDSNPAPLINPPTGYNENPMPFFIQHEAGVTGASRPGFWSASFDFLRDEVTKGHSTSVGFAFSIDGLSWPGAAGVSVDVAAGLPPAPGHQKGARNDRLKSNAASDSNAVDFWVKSLRTPHTPILEADGSYTLFFTATPRSGTFRGVGRTSVRIGLEGYL